MHKVGVSFMRLLPFASFVALVLVACLPGGAAAQSSDAVGIRAQGMGGAFTALADDATATWWNPAGLAGGAYLNAIVEYGRVEDTDTDRRGFSVAFPALGLSYYRTRVTQAELISSTAASGGVRQD